MVVHCALSLPLVFTKKPMGITHQHKLWRLGQAVAKGESLSDPRRWGGLPFELQKFKNIMPGKTTLHHPI